MSEPVSLNHAIGDPVSAQCQADDPVVLAGFRRAGAGVRICTVCGVLVVPTTRSRGNWRHQSHPDARILISPEGS